MTIYRQRITPNVSALTGYGWCHQYVQDAFGLPLMYASAREAWDNAEGRHTSNPPKGVWTAVFFDWKASNGINYGHVIIHGPDGRIYTSPIQPGHAKSDRHESYPSMDSLYDYLRGLKYLGWVEIMHGHRLIEAITTPTKPAPGQEEDDEMEPRYIADSKVGTQGTVYQLTSDGRKRAIPSAEWSAIRAIQAASGNPLPIGLVSAADLKKIPNA